MVLLRSIYIDETLEIGSYGKVCKAKCGGPFNRLTAKLIGELRIKLHLTSCDPVLLGLLRKACSRKLSVQDHL